MQPTKRLLAIVAPFLAFILFCGTSFKAPDTTTDTTTVKKPCEATCDFSPTLTDFTAVNFSNCNSSAGTAPVLAGTSYIPILVGTGCITAIIDVTLPAIHPAGTVTIDRNGVNYLTISVPANTSFGMPRKVPYSCDDYYTVHWN